MAKAKNTPFISNNIFQTNYFIENKGQFNQIAKHMNKVDFTLHHHNDEIYFNAASVQFHVLEQEIISVEKKDNERIKRLNPISEDWFTLNWLDSNPNATIIKKGKTDHYFSFGSQELVSYGYQSITYQDLCPGIDVEYKVNPKGGIEYSLFISPGADLSLVKFRYDANRSLSTQIEKNKITIRNKSGYLVESGIKAFYKNSESVPIEYYNKGKKIIGYKSLIKINNKRSLIIDPWVSASSALSGTIYNEHAFDVDYDLNGNTIVMGGGGGFNTTTNLPKVAKYDLAGNLQWVFAGFNSSPAWYSSIDQAYCGNFVVDKNTNKIYISQPLNIAGSEVLQLTSAGTFDSFITAPNNKFREIWDLKFNCNSGEVIAFGGATNSNLHLGVIDTTIGSLNTYNITGHSVSRQDIACASLDMNGELYTIFSAAQSNYANNRIYKLNSSFTSFLWNTHSGFSILTEASNRPNTGVSLNSNAINCMSVNNFYLFYYDGYNLKAFNKTNGSSVGNALTNNLVPKFQYGIYSNNCNEVYVGRNKGEIYKYFFNGTDFILQDTLVINGQANSSIYDIEYNPVVDQLIISGEGFVSSINTSSNCVQNSGSANFNLGYNVYCIDSATVTVYNGNPGKNYTFRWFDITNNLLLRETTESLGVFTSGIGNISYNHKIKVTVIESSSTPCQLNADKISFVMTCTFDTMLYKMSCPGDTITINSELAFTPGLYIDTFLNSSNQDSIVATLFSFYPIKDTSLVVSICQGQNYQLPNNTFVSSTGTYTDTLQTLYGCDSIITTLLSVITPTPINISARICINDSYVLPSNTSTNVAGVYTDTLKTVTGCDSIIITALSVTPIPSIDLGPDTMICSDKIIELDASIPGNASYVWQNFSTNPTIRVFEPGTYFVAVTVAPCPAVIDTINLLPCNCQVILPNAFTPNGDNNNDVFRPIFVCNIPLSNYKFSVFNRWGERVFSTTSRNKGWDGLLRNYSQSTGTYFYTPRFKNPESGNIESYRGNVILIK